MKLFYGSDLHLEFEKGFKHTIDVPEGDVLVLAGDIYTPWYQGKTEKKDHVKIRESFFSEVSEKFKTVLYVMGNHEHYGGYFVQTDDLIRKHLEPYKNIHLLTGNYYQVEDVLFYGTTFWTDARNSHPEVMWDIQRGMNDYHEIKYSEDRYDVSSGMYNGYNKRSRLLCEDTVKENQFARKQLTEFFSKSEECGLRPFVITHHQPSWKCVEMRWQLDNLSHAYANTGLDDLLEETPEHYWVCGHMHKTNDLVEVGKSKVLTHARGYIGYESSANSYSFAGLDI